MDEEQQYESVSQYPLFTSDQMQDGCRVLKGLAFTSTCGWWMLLFSSGALFWWILLLGAISGGIWTGRTVLSIAGIDVGQVIKGMRGQKKVEVSDDADYI